MKIVRYIRNDCIIREKMLYIDNRNLHAYFDKDSEYMECSCLVYNSIPHEIVSFLSYYL